MAWPGTVRRGVQRVGSATWAIVTIVASPSCEQAPEEAFAAGGSALVIDGGASWDSAEGVLSLAPTADRPHEPSGQITLRNGSDRTIELEEPMVSCGCTSAVLDARRLAPGENATLQCRVSWTSSRPVRQVVWIRERDGGTLRIAVAVDPILIQTDEIVIAEPVVHASGPTVVLPLLLVHRSGVPPLVPACAALEQSGERPLDSVFDGWRRAVPAGSDQAGATILVGRLVIPRSQLLTEGDGPAIVRIAMDNAQPMHVVVRPAALVVAQAEEQR